MELETASGPLSLDLERVGAVLRPAAHVPYAPPHVFPMSAPNFVRAPEAERPRPSAEPIGLYLHVPFCRYACNFCFYVKKIGAGRAEMEGYVAALRRELEWLPEAAPLTQLFVGGGTPTALPADLLDALLGEAFGRVDRSAESVHTVECSPETLTDGHLAVLDAHGVGRVSLGIQTLDDAILGRIHRRHSSAEALSALERLVASGRMVNVDLIYGLPGQSEASFRADFEAVAERGVHCVNAYNLRVNEGTPILAQLREEERLELGRLAAWRAAVERTAAEFGYRQTHWQRFMREGVRFELDLTRSNLLGVGVSARSFLDHAVYRNHTGLAAYLERIEGGRSPVEEVFPLDAEHRKTYFVTRTLGAGKRLERAAWAREFGGAFDDDYGEVSARLVGAGLVADDGDSVSLTPTGRLVYDLVTLAFYPPSLQGWLEERHAQAIARRRRGSGAAA